MPNCPTCGRSAMIYNEKEDTWHCPICDEKVERAWESQTTIEGKKLPSEAEKRLGKIAEKVKKGGG